MENETLIIDNLVNAPVLSAEREGSNNTVFEKLAAEGCENYFDYVKLLGLEKDPNLIALSSLHHYYYDAEDLREVKTVVNLKQLNQIKKVRDFLQSINLVLSHESYFIGSFTDRKSLNRLFINSLPGQIRKSANDEAMENGIESGIPLLNILYDILDSRTNRYMTKKTVISMLEGAGLKVLDMTELNGLTYFCTNKVRATA